MSHIRKIYSSKVIPAAVQGSGSQCKEHMEGTVAMHRTIRHLLEINPFPNKPVFTCLQYKPFENTLGKKEIARYEQFVLFPQCFLPV